MHPFEPRLLIPGTSGIPAHMRVSHDVRVYEEMADPAVSAVIHVPQWSQNVRDVFARLAALPFGSVKNFKSDATLQPGFWQRDSANLRDFLSDMSLVWMLPALKQGAGEENAAAIAEVAAHKLAFAQATSRYLRPSTKPALAWMTSALQNFSATENNSLSFTPHQPHACIAHTDPTDSGLFSLPIGTILVDQTDLPIKQLRVNRSAHSHGLALTHLANRLWQVPDGSFGLWRGDSHPSAQYHFIPSVPRDLQRYRLFGHP